MKECHAETRLVFLVGFMGAGKTSVGRTLSERLGWTFEDLDDRIRRVEGLTIEEIFRESGEAEFRRMEHAALRATLSELNAAPRVVGLGGGAFVQPGNASLLKETGAPVVFLDAPVEELWRRCQGEAQHRPLQRNEQEFRDLYELRLPHYRQAEIRIDTAGKTVQMVAAEVEERLGLKAVVDTKES